MATGDELEMPGSELRDDQIVSSVPYGLAELVRRFGGIPRRLGIARDNRESLLDKIETARSSDILVTIGGASVGDHDLVGPVLEDAGMKRDFWRIAMRPGKPLMFGQMGRTQVLGVPGNPVSALVCGRVCLVPRMAALQGAAYGASEVRNLPLVAPLGANGPRRHFMRGSFDKDPDGRLGVAPAESQDSALMATLADADCLIVRPPHAEPAKAGEHVDVLPLDF